MDEIARKRLERKLREKLSPQQVTGNLLSASLFLVAYELLKVEVIGKTRDFFLEGSDESGMKYSPRYASDVVALSRDRYRASCLWLARLGAISDADVDVAQRIRVHRHEVAHELPRLLIDPEAKIDLPLFSDAQRLLTALGRFWGRIEVDTNPSFDDQDVSDADIKSGPMLLMEHIFAILGSHDT